MLQSYHHFDGGSKEKEMSDDKERGEGLTDDEYDTLQEDIEQEKEEANQKYGYGGPRRFTVSEALRVKKGHVQVIGQIVTVSSVYNMVSAADTECPNCGTKSTYNYYEKDGKPRYAPPNMKDSKCTSCDEKGLKVRPKWMSVVDVELQDTEKFNDIERLFVKLFEDDSKEVRAGEIVTVTGDLDVDKKTEGPRGRYITILYCKSIEYTRKERAELTQGDIEYIEGWKKSVEEQGKNIVDALVEKFVPTVVGNGFAKRSLLLAGVNAGIKNDDDRDPRRLRINVLLVGDPSQAKSVMLRKIVDIIYNARYESAQGSTGLSLTFMVTKENDSHLLRLGPIPLANGSLCAINEMGQMPLEQQRHFLDFAEEGWSTNNKYGINAIIIGNTSLVASANPYGGHWKHPNEIEIDEIPILSQIVERADILVIFRETKPDREKEREYVAAINEIRKNSKNGHYIGYDEFLRVYLMYARTFNPNAEISDDALNMIDEYWVEMSQKGVRGRYRKLESLKRITVAISKLKLKNEADTDDVTEMMELYNVILLHFNQIVPVSQRPKEITSETYVSILREASAYPIAFRELAKTANERKEQINSYIGDDLNIETNRKLRAVYDELLNNEHIILVQQKPAVFQWRQRTDTREEGETMVKADRQASDTSDVSDRVGSSGYNEKECEGVSVPTSDRSDMSDSTYEHLMERQYLPNLNRTIYRCKECPNAPEYYDLNGIIKSHFQPFHK